MSERFDDFNMILQNIIKSVKGIIDGNKQLKK